MKTGEAMFIHWLLAASLFVGLAGCDVATETDEARYFEMSREERVLHTLAEANYNGENALTMHFVLFAQSLEAAELVANELAMDDQTTGVEIRGFPPHQGVLVRGDSTPMVVNRNTLDTLQRRLDNAARPHGAFLIGWGPQIYKSPPQDGEAFDLGLFGIRNEFLLMNLTLRVMLADVNNANINAANAAAFLKDLKSLNLDVIGAKYAIQYPYLGSFYGTDFDDWYFELTFMCELMDEIEFEYLFPVPGPNDPRYNIWKRNVLENLAGIKDQISELQDFLRSAIDEAPADVNGIPHPVTQHLRDLLARLERLKAALDRARQDFDISGDYQEVLNILARLKTGKRDFIIDLPLAPANTFTLYGVSFYEWFRTLKLLDEVLDRIHEFEFRDPTDKLKTDADINRLKQIINEAKALKELMEKWKLTSQF